MHIDIERVHALCRRAKGAQILASLQHRTVPGLAEIQEAAEALQDGKDNLPSTALGLAIMDRIAAGESLRSVCPEAWELMYGPPKS